MMAVAILSSLAFIGWIIWRAAKRKPFKAHVVSYILTCVSGVLTLTFFLSMDMPEIVKILVSIIAGSVLIFIAAWFQRRMNPDQQ